MQVHEQQSPYHSPWTISQRIKMLLWEYTWAFLCSWTPKPANRWRVFWLKVFGAKIHGKPFVHQRARIQIPWNITLHHKSAIGDRANLYSLGPIEVFEHATIAQESYICTGTHAFNKNAMNLITIPISIGPHAFVGARAFIMPGVKIGAYAVIGACSIVTKEMPEMMICMGQPCKPVSRREIEII
jgi:putative colanic acid biosynthesis acetyltransferase WcaF